MTLSWLRPLQEFEGRLREAPRPLEQLEPLASATTPEPEFDEEGRQYVFRFPRRQATPVKIDRERLFDYVATHKLPRTSDRVRLRDQRNAANFFEDVREIQTHPDVQTLAKASPLRIVS
jgi:hypothetical protein